MTDLDPHSLRAALAGVAVRLPARVRIEIVVVGGAAALLGGLLPLEVTTLDCDVAVHPREAWPVLRQAAEEVATEHGLSRDWFNAECQQSTVGRLPLGWEDRTRPHRFGQLRVLSVGRLDYLAMKVIAGREMDIEHIRNLEPLNPRELAFVREYLTDLESRFPQEAPFVADAVLLLDDIASRSAS